MGFCMVSDVSFVLFRPRGGMGGFPYDYTSPYLAFKHIHAAGTLRGLGRSSRCVPILGQRGRISLGLRLSLFLLQPHVTRRGLWVV